MGGRGRGGGGEGVGGIYFSILKSNYKLLFLMTFPDQKSDIEGKRESRKIRPFYRYGGHIELIRFKEYYRIPRGHERISFVFSSAFRDIFS